MVNHYKKIVLLHGLEYMNDYNFRVLKSLLIQDLKLTKKMQDDYDRVKIADLMDEKFPEDAGLSKLIEVCECIPELGDRVDILRKEMEKVESETKIKSESSTLPLTSDMMKVWEVAPDMTTSSSEESMTDTIPESCDTITQFLEEEPNFPELSATSMCPSEREPVTPQKFPTATSNRLQSPLEPPEISSTILATKGTPTLSFGHQATLEFPKTEPSNVRAFQMTRAIMTNDHNSPQVPAAEAVFSSFSKSHVTPATVPSSAQTSRMTPAAKTSGCNSSQVSAATGSNSYSTPRVTQATVPSSVQSLLIPRAALPNSAKTFRLTSAAMTSGCNSPRASGARVPVHYSNPGVTPATVPSGAQTLRLNPTAMTSGCNSPQVSATTVSSSYSNTRVTPATVSSSAQTLQMTPAAKTSGFKSPQVSAATGSSSYSNPRVIPATVPSGAQILRLTPAAMTSSFNSPQVSAATGSSSYSNPQVTPTTVSSSAQTFRMTPAAMTGSFNSPQVSAATGSSSYSNSPQVSSATVPRSFPAMPMSPATPLKKPRLKNIPRQPSEEDGHQQGSKQVVVLKVTEPFTYDMREDKRMFHATVATEIEFFRVKVFDTALKEKFIPNKVIVISDYIGYNGFLEIYRASCVSEVNDGNVMNIPSSLRKRANETPKISTICTQRGGTFVNGTFTVYMKTVKSEFIYYGIEDRTGRMEVVVYGQFANMYCEPGDKLRLFCFELSSSLDKWQLRSVRHSYMQVIQVRKREHELPNLHAIIETAQNPYS
ncbi:inteferon-activable protein 208-like isoform X10 [Apodemus sylvaticus]|uniref:inteferon-activable protein 208-like isoform X10 n=1 Tax=Apodemus sylvaticus TaxID=10129 RepID=UPI002241D722|nr:inteferon-activable protein 208-like isoform X10 [Apodemus sylvaticus]